MYAHPGLSFLSGDDSAVTHIPAEAIGVAQVCTLFSTVLFVKPLNATLSLRESESRWQRRPAMLITGMIQPSAKLASDVIRRNRWEGRSLETLQMDCFI